MSVQTASFFFAALSLVALAGAGAAAIIAVLARSAVGADRLGWLRADLGRAALGLAFGVATVAMLGSLYYSEIAGFTPCKLCWYQRIAMYPLTIVLGVAALRRDSSARFTVVPIAMIGAGIAAYHAWIQAFPPTGGSAFCTADVPCTDRFVWEFGFVSLPFMALSGFIFIITMAFIARPTASENEGDADGADDHDDDEAGTLPGSGPTDADTAELIGTRP
jgi:hypothetical protein